MPCDFTYMLNIKKVNKGKSQIQHKKKSCDSYKRKVGAEG